MFKAIFPEAKTWKNIIEAISILVDEGVFIAGPGEIKLRAMDPSRVAMVDLEIPSSAFESYECDSEIPIGVNFDDMKSIVKRAKSDEKLELEIAQARLKIKLIGKTFSMPLLDLGKEELSIPKISFSVNTRLLTSALEEAIKDAEVVSDFIKIIAENDLLKIMASGDRGEVEIEITSGELLSIELKEPSHALYSLNYLKKMMTDLSDVCTLMFSTDMPLRLDFNMAIGGKVTYYLAPRIET
ncbi:MAG: proliferating cell nuclear antigen (pcna) [candidate division WOR-3 bacterium]